MNEHANIYELRQDAYMHLEENFNGFITKLKEQPKDIIINSAYELVEKEQILDLFTPQNEVFGKNQLDAVLYLNKPLEFIHNAWLNSNGSSFDEMLFCIKDTLNKEYDKIQALDKNVTRVFVDMDGVLAVFNKVDKIEELYEKDYFTNLKPIDNMVAAVNSLNKDPLYDVYILSSVLKDSEYAETEKLNWLHKEMPEIKPEQIIFSECGKSKVDFVPDGIRKTDMLLDDYTRNLNDWKQAGGKAVKVMNGINNKTHFWQGDKVHTTSEPLIITRDICYATGKEPILNIPQIEPILPNQIPDMGGLVQA